MREPSADQLGNVKKPHHAHTLSRLVCQETAIQTSVCVNSIKGRALLAESKSILAGTKEDYSEGMAKVHIF